MKPARMTATVGTVILWAGCVGVLAATGILVRHLNGPRVVAQAVAPDGTEMRIVQRCNWSGEPFTTGFYYRPPGAASWGWFYMDHEDDYWSSRAASVTVNTNFGAALFCRNGVVVVTFDWEREHFTLQPMRRAITGAQTWLPPGQEPR